MFTTYGRGNGIPQIGIVMTDGKSNKPALTRMASQKVKFVISINKNCLSTIVMFIVCGDDDNVNHLY